MLLEKYVCGYYSQRGGLVTYLDSIHVSDSKEMVKCF